jgi:superfamily II DNA or RNA helicase
MSNKELASKVDTFINKNNLVEPLNWVLPNRKEFVEWVNETFLKYRATGKEQPHSKKFTPFKYQQLLRDYMQNNSPYRGVLLYHSLGSGKTCTAITIAENLKTERNIVVMLPASLRTNFIEDGLLFCGDEKYKSNKTNQATSRLNSSNFREKYSFISYNANNTIQQLKKIGSLDNKVIIIEEVHNLISKIMSGLSGSSKQGLEIYNYLMNAQNAKIVALSGTPIINDPFEAAILFNMLRGFIEITYYRIISVSPMYGDKWDFSSLEEELSSNKLIDYFEINKINKSIEFHIKVKHYTEEYKATLEFIEKTCKDHNILAKFLELKKNPLFPIDNDGETFHNYFVNEDIEKGDKLKNNEVFKRRILGLVSYYKSSEANYPKVEHKNYYRVPMSNYQFQIYELLRAKERISERGSAEKKTKAKSKKQVKSTFRVFSRQASNFVFPEEIHRPYPDPTFIVSLKKNKENKNLNLKNKINTQKQTERIMELEEQANNNGKIASDYKKRINNAIEELVENGEEYFTGQGLDKLSPKMKIILENVQLSPGLVFIYSNFRTLEGVEIFSKILDFNGFVKYGEPNPNNYPTYSIYSGTEDEKDKKKILKIFTSDKNKYGSEIKIILATSAGAEGLDLKNIRQIHIMEPYWNQTRIEQVIGRGVRRNSHIALPEKDRNIEIFRYFSIFSPKNSQITRDKLSTDEHIEQLSRKKQYIINELIQILKECAFDCVLNAPDIKGEYQCFNFGKNAEGFSYTPSISKNIIAAHTVQNIKKVERTLTRGIYYEKHVYLFDTKKKKFYLYNDENKNPVEIDTKKAKPLFVDKKTNEVFDIKSVEAQNPIRLGYIKSDNKISKKKDT